MKSGIRDMKHPTLAHFRHFSSLFTNVRSTPVENVRQISFFMQNKAKVKYAKININSVIIMRYEKMDIWLFRQTNPIQTQLLQRPKLIQSIYIKSVMMIKPYCGFVKTKPIKPNNQSSLITNHLEGKANSNPIFVPLAVLIVYNDSPPSCFREKAGGRI